MDESFVLSNLERALSLIESLKQYNSALEIQYKVLQKRCKAGDDLIVTLSQVCKTLSDEKAELEKENQQLCKLLAEHGVYCD